MIRGALALSIVTSLALAGCSVTTTPDTASTGGAGAAGTVSIDVGNGKVDLPTGKLRLGLFFPAQINAFQKEIATAAKSKAESLGWTATILDANYDVSTQQNQLQTAATNKSFDAAIVVPVDESECDAVSNILPKAGILVSVATGPVCNRTTAEGKDLWVPGTLNYVGGDTDVTYFTGWFNGAAKLITGKQNVAFITGAELSAYTRVHKAAVAAFQKNNSDFVVNDYIYTDYSTPVGYTAVLNYLRAHPEVNVLMSCWPDLTRAAVRAVDAAGLTGKVKIIDIGGSSYTVDEIKAGAVTATVGLFSASTGVLAVQSIADAQSGKTPERYLSNIPAGHGTVTDPQFFTAANIADYTPSN